MRFSFGNDVVVEEHVLVPKPGSTKEGEGWLVGMGYDIPRRRSFLSVFDAQRLAATLNDGITQHSEQFQNIVRITQLLGGPNSGLIGNTLSGGAALERRTAEASAGFSGGSIVMGRGSSRSCVMSPRGAILAQLGRPPPAARSKKPGGSRRRLLLYQQSRHRER